MKFVSLNICSICKNPKSIKHYFFDCFFAKEFWNISCVDLDGWGDNGCINLKEILCGSIEKLDKTLNLF